MTYGLDAFSSDLHNALKAKGLAGLPEIAEKLKALLVDPGFVAATFAGAPVPQRVLYHDADSDAYVLAHVQEAGKSGRPHSHGASWAVYGNVRGTTEMTEWRRVNPEDEDHAVLEATERYLLEPGQTRAYGPGVIHSTAHPHGALVIRVTGTDLNAIPRYHFRPKKDKILQTTTA
ncbi:MAG TPA: hypothetical protein VMU87_20170 [Stellaceae bacterium]|nr:hypothetical protein [Stellaceae bacterium]